MMAKKFARAVKSESVEERKRHNAIRHQLTQEFPPKRTAAKTATGIGRQFRDARTAQDLTWCAVAQKAAIPNSGTVRAIEEGQDAKLSSVEVTDEAFGLR